MPTLTLRELAEILDPPMTPQQIATLTWIHIIPAVGERRTGRRGRPASIYPLGAVKYAHHQEATRTTKNFTDNDWIGAALLALELIRVDSDAGEIRWFNGDRAERLGNGNYGYVHAARERCPAHRIIWLAADGEIPPTIQINHINQLRWDNRRANLELVTFGNNIRHAHGNHYVNYHDAVSELVELPPALEMPPPAASLMRAGGVFRHPNGH